MPCWKRLRNPRRGELHPSVVVGWWDEQLLRRWGYRGAAAAPIGCGAAKGRLPWKSLLNAVASSRLWPAGQPAIRLLGELDCALLHGKAPPCEATASQRQLTTVYCSIASHGMDVKSTVHRPKRGGNFCVELSGGLDFPTQAPRWRGEHHQSVKPARKVNRRGAA